MRDDQVATTTPVDTREPTIGPNGLPIDFAAYEFDPHTLLAVLLLSLAIAILFMTALTLDKRQMRKLKAFPPHPRAYAREEASATTKEVERHQEVTVKDILIEIAENLTHSLGIALYIREGEISQ